MKDVTLHIVDWAGGEPTIVAIHGSAGMGHTFGAMAERLAPIVRFVGVDLRGHGFSDKPPAGYDLDWHVEDIRQLIADLGLRRPVVLGHSAGGTVAAFVALPTDVAGVILLEAMIGNRAFTEDAAAQSAPLATSLGVPVVGFDAYHAEWRARVANASATMRSACSTAGYASPWRRCPAGRIACEPWLGGRPYFSRPMRMLRDGHDVLGGEWEVVRAPVGRLT